MADFTPLKCPEAFIGESSQGALSTTDGSKLCEALTAVGGNMVAAVEEPAAVSTQAEDDIILEVPNKLPTEGVPTDEKGVHRAKTSTVVLGTNLRRSNRSMAKNDEHMMAKVARMAAARNLETTGNKSFTSFSDSRISSSMKKVGISFGRDDNLVKSSTVAKKSIELDRLALPILNHICGDEDEALQEQEYDHELCDLIVVPRKKKSNSAKKITTDRPPKNPKIP